MDLEPLTRGDVQHGCLSPQSGLYNSATFTLPVLGGSGPSLAHAEPNRQTQALLTASPAVSQSRTRGRGGPRSGRNAGRRSSRTNGAAAHDGRRRSTNLDRLPDWQKAFIKAFAQDLELPTQVLENSASTIYDWNSWIGAQLRADHWQPGNGVWATLAPRALDVRLAHLADFCPVDEYKNDLVRLLNFNIVARCKGLTDISEMSDDDKSLARSRNGDNRTSGSVSTRMLIDLSFALNDVALSHELSYEASFSSMLSDVRQGVVVATTTSTASVPKDRVSQQVSSGHATVAADSRRHSNSSSNHAWDVPNGSESPRPPGHPVSAVIRRISEQGPLCASTDDSLRMQARIKLEGILLNARTLVGSTQRSVDKMNLASTGADFLSDSSSWCSLAVERVCDEFPLIRMRPQSGEETLIKQCLSVHPVGKPRQRKQENALYVDFVVEERVLKDWVRDLFSQKHAVRLLALSTIYLDSLRIGIAQFTTESYASVLEQAATLDQTANPEDAVNDEVQRIYKSRLCDAVIRRALESSAAAALNRWISRKAQPMGATVSALSSRLRARVPAQHMSHVLEQHAYAPAEHGVTLWHALEFALLLNRIKCTLCEPIYLEGETASLVSDIGGTLNGSDVHLHNHVEDSGERIYAMYDAPSTSEHGEAAPVGDSPAHVTAIDASNCQAEIASQNVWTNQNGPQLIDDCLGFIADQLLDQTLNMEFGEDCPSAEVAHPKLVETSLRESNLCDSALDQNSNGAEVVTLTSSFAQPRRRASDSVFDAVARQRERKELEITLAKMIRSLCENDTSLVETWSTRLTTCVIAYAVASPTSPSTFMRQEALIRSIFQAAARYAMFEEQPNQSTCTSMIEYQGPVSADECRRQGLMLALNLSGEDPKAALRILESAIGLTRSETQQYLSGEKGVPLQSQRKLLSWRLVNHTFAHTGARSIRVAMNTVYELIANADDANESDFVWTEAGVEGHRRRAESGDPIAMEEYGALLGRRSQYAGTASRAHFLQHFDLSLQYLVAAMRAGCSDAALHIIHCLEDDRVYDAISPAVRKNVAQALCDHAINDSCGETKLYLSYCLEMVGVKGSGYGLPLARKLYRDVLENHWHELPNSSLSYCANNLGVMYDTGKGGERDEEEAVRLLNRATRFGCGGGRLAMMNLGDIHQRGWTLPRDLVRAHEMYRDFLYGETIGQLRDKRVKSSIRIPITLPNADRTIWTRYDIRLRRAQHEDFLQALVNGTFISLEALDRICTVVSGYIIGGPGFDDKTRQLLQGVDMLDVDAVNKLGHIFGGQTELSKVPKQFVVEALSRLETAAEFLPEACLCFARLHHAEVPRLTQDFARAHENYNRVYRNTDAAISLRVKAAFWLGEMYEKCEASPSMEASRAEEKARHFYGFAQKNGDFPESRAAELRMADLLRREFLRSGDQASLRLSLESYVRLLSRAEEEANIVDPASSEDDERSSDAASHSLLDVCSDDVRGAVRVSVQELPDCDWWSYWVMVDPGQKAAFLSLLPGEMTEAEFALVARNGSIIDSISRPPYIVRSLRSASGAERVQFAIQKAQADSRLGLDALGQILCSQKWSADQRLEQSAVDRAMSYLQYRADSGDYVALFTLATVRECARPGIGGDRTFAETSFNNVYMASNMDARPGLARRAAFGVARVLDQGGADHNLIKEFQIGQWLLRALPELADVFERPVRSSSPTVTDTQHVSQDADDDYGETETLACSLSPAPEGYEEVDEQATPNPPIARSDETDECHAAYPYYADFLQRGWSRDATPERIRVARKLFADYLERGTASDARCEVRITLRSGKLHLWQSVTLEIAEDDVDRFVNAIGTLALSVETAGHYGRIRQREVRSHQFRECIAIDEQLVET